MPKTYGAIINLALDKTDEIYAYTLPMTVREFTMKTRSGEKFFLAYEEGGKTLTVEKEKTVSDLDLHESKGCRTLYFQPSKDNDTLEIEYWKSK